MKFLKEPGTVALMAQYGFTLPRDVAHSDAETSAH
jgi:hypothetical protein